MKFELPKLPYEYDALEPFVDKETMEIHHTKHHQTYVTKLNEAVEKYPELQEKTVEELLMDLESVPEEIRTAVRNTGGGHANHSMFWTIMASPKTGGGGEPSGELMKAINASFGDFPKFKDTFSKTAVGVFGSGWAWLVKNGDFKLAIATTPNQDSPLSKHQIPVLCLDVWQ